MIKSIQQKRLLCGALLCTFGVTIVVAQSDPSKHVPSGADAIAPEFSPPDTGLVWFRSPDASNSALSRLYMHSASMNLHRGKNFARGQFFLDVETTVELPGSVASARIDGGTPTFFVRKTTDEQEAEDSRAAGNEPVTEYRLVLVRLETVGPNRVVYGFREHAIAGKPKLVFDEVQLHTEAMAGGAWRKITPQQPLANGEYALGLVNEATLDVSSVVFDFGVGPALPPKKR